MRAEEEALRALFLALEGGGELPPAAELPPPEAFLDPDLRKFFAAFRGLYLSGAEVDLRGVLAAAGEVPDADGRAAQILVELEDSTVPPASEALRALRRRWLKSRLRELHREISEAERRGDHARTTELIAEKLGINDELHGRSARGSDLE